MYRWVHPVCVATSQVLSCAHSHFLSSPSGSCRLHPKTIERLRARFRNGPRQPISPGTWGQASYAVLIFVVISAISASVSYFLRCQMSRVENNPSPLFLGTT